MRKYYISLGIAVVIGLIFVLLLDSSSLAQTSGASDSWTIGGTGCATTENMQGVASFYVCGAFAVESRTGQVKFCSFTSAGNTSCRAVR